MSLEVNKIKSYLGFAMKSSSIIYGVDDIIKSRKSKIILYVSSLGESSKDKLMKFLNTNQIFGVECTEENFEEWFGNKNIKAVAVTDINLAAAIKKNVTI